jgi:hypothetical protein
VKNKILNKVALFIIVVLSLVTCLCKSSAPLVAAMDLNPHNYFNIDYNTELSKTHIQIGEIFKLTVEGAATCIKDLPVGIDLAELTLSISAYNQDSNTSIVLTDDFVIEIEPFPDWKNESYQFVQSLDLVFPRDSSNGSYEVLGQLISARIDGWDITEFIPPQFFTFNFGTLTYDGSMLMSPIDIIMNINPQTVNPGEAVTIKVRIRNNTSIDTCYLLKMSINGVLQDYREITMAPLEENSVAFIIKRYEEGDYIVSLDGYSDKFSVEKYSDRSIYLITQNRLIFFILLYVIIFIL